MDHEKIKAGVKLILEGIGEDPGRDGVRETPARYARMCEEIFSGIGQEPERAVKVLGAQEHDEIVLVKNIPFQSMCEHHMLPFIGRCHVAYLPDGGRVTGISKLARIVDIMSKRLQVQERLTTSIAETIMKALKPKGVMVVMEAEHLCMSMRGVRKPGSKVVTSVVRGCFRKNAATRAEAMALISERQ